MFYILGSSAPSVTTQDIIGALSPVTDQFSVSNITSFIVALLGIVIVFVFLWWGVRFAFRRITSNAMGRRRGL